jgi:hypothetical protein
MWLWSFLTWAGRHADKISTSGAFFLGLAVYGTNARDRRRQQASLVAAWISYKESHAIATEDRTSLLRRKFRKPRTVVPGPTSWDEYEIHLRNGSTEPVYEVWLDSALVHTDPRHFPVLPPNTTETFGASERMAPGQTRHGADFRLWFTDSYGRRWHRGSNGRLTRKRLDPWKPRRRAKTMKMLSEGKSLEGDD